MDESLKAELRIIRDQVIPLVVTVEKILGDEEYHLSREEIEEAALNLTKAEELLNSADMLKWDRELFSGDTN